jgi:hypothetical protein
MRQLTTSFTADSAIELLIGMGFDDQSHDEPLLAAAQKRVNLAAKPHVYFVPK